MQTTFLENADVLEARATPTVSWLEPLPLAYRKKRGFIALGIGAALAVWLAYLQWDKGVLGEKESAWLIVCLAVGAWRYRAWMQKEPVRRYLATPVVLTRSQRLKKAMPFLVLGFGGPVALVALQWWGNTLDYWKTSLVLLPLGFVGLFIYAFLRREALLTPEAAIERTHYTALEQQTEGHWADKVGRVLALKPVRYPGAAALLWFAYTLAQEPKPGWVGVGAMVFWALVAAKELFLWLLIAGIVVGVLALGFNMIAALPLSVAVIIGALIIAGGMKK